MAKYSAMFYGVPREIEWRDYLISNLPVEEIPDESPDARDKRHELIVSEWLTSIQQATDNERSIIIGNRVVNPKHFLLVKVAVTRNTY